MAILELSSLTPREAVADALYRCLLGIDTNDHELFESALLKTEALSITAGPVVLNGWTAVKDFFQVVFKVVTTHTVSNIRIDLGDGASTATMTASAVACHIRPEDAFKVEDNSYTARNLYTLSLVKDADGLWKIEKWDLNALWTTGDRAVLFA